MEEKILRAVIKRNQILDELISITHVAIAEFENFDQQDLLHFFLTREFFIQALVEEENKIIAYSMMDWNDFKFSESYREDYLSLSREKEDMVTTLVGQDKVLGSIMENQDCYMKTA